MLLFGHRGLGADRFKPTLPENTIPSLLAAAALPNVAAVEFDVMATADGVLVLHHDFVCRGFPVGKTKFSALPTQLPLFTDFLRKFQATGKGMICEVKYPSANSQRFPTTLNREATADFVLKYLEASPPAWFYVSSFDPDLCVFLARKAKTIFNVWFGHEADGYGEHDFLDPRNSDPHAALRFCREVCTGGMAVEIAWLLKNLWFVEEAREQGVNIFTYGTENSDPAMIEKQREWGVDVVIADCVDRLIN